MPPEKDHYTKVLLNDNMPVEDSVTGHEIQLIVGSPLKLTESALVDFALEFTKHMRVNQGWNTVHVVVQPMEFQELPPLGKPSHTEAEQSTWIIE